MKLPTYFISHGGGPWPWMDGPYRRQHDKLHESLRQVALESGKPRAILVISAHWEEPGFTVQAAAAPGMIYDYGGFPAHTFQIRYPSAGAPDVARRVQELLAKAGIPAAFDADRGYDHGTYAPLYSMYPQADVPVLQLSLKHGYDPEEHLAVGRALAPLRDEGVLIVGSGLSYHNLRRFGPAAREPSEAFDGWLDAAMRAPALSRSQWLREWSTAPAARIAHPQEDHLMPLMVAVGAAEQEPAERVYHEQGFMGGVTAASYRFGAAAPVNHAFFDAPGAHTGIASPVPQGVPMSNDDMPDFSNVKSGSSSTATKVYVVVSGDSLSKIAKREYGDANAWKRIFEANQDILKDPDKIQPGQKLKIPPK